MSRIVSCAVFVVVLLMIGCVDNPTGEATERSVLFSCDPTLQCFNPDPIAVTEYNLERDACPCVTAPPDVLVPGSAFSSPSDPAVATAPAVLPIGSIARDPVASLTCDTHLEIEFCIQITNSSGTGQLCSKRLDCFPGTGLSLSIVMPPFGPVVDAMTAFQLIIIGGAGMHVVGVDIPVGHP